MENKLKKKIKQRFLIYLEVFLFIGLFLIIFSNFSGIVFAEIGEPNATVITILEVGNVFPEVLLVTLPEDVTLIPNSTRLVSCVAIVRDWNEHPDIDNVYAEFFDMDVSDFGEDDEWNNHYTNSSCELVPDFGDYMGISSDAYTILSNCTFYVQYYANPGINNWNCTVVVNDTYNWNGTGNNVTTMNELLAIGLPDVIDYGTVNATYVSEEQIANVTNFGNVQINLSLEGYARTQGDGLAMNCTLGNIGEINITYERYNLTESNAGALNSLSEFDAAPYINLTSSPIIKQFNLNYKQDDTVALAHNSTYWRIYVPIGVAGTCQGNIIVGATQDDGS